jgi:hypothetical protein
MACIVAETLGWPIEDTWEDNPERDESKWGVVRRFEANWHAFVKGGHLAPVKRERRRRDYSLDLVESDIEGEGESQASI